MGLLESVADLSKPYLTRKNTNSLKNLWLLCFL